MDIRSSKERISGAESNEQQRNWNKNMWVNKTNDPLKNYDPTRAHLNFEVARGGKIQPIDTSMSIDEKMNQILQERGIKMKGKMQNVKIASLLNSFWAATANECVKLHSVNRQWNTAKGPTIPN